MSEVVNYSVKIDAETKEDLVALIDQSGATAKEFIAHLISSYKINRDKETMPQIKELEGLRHHLIRIEEIYVSLIKSSQDRQEADLTRISQAESALMEARAVAHEVQQQAEKAIEEAQQRVDAAVQETNSFRANTEKELEDIRAALAKAQEDREQALRLAALSEKAAASADEKLAELKDVAEQAKDFKKKWEDALAHVAQVEINFKTSTGQLEQEKEMLKIDLVNQINQLQQKLDSALKQIELQKESHQKELDNQIKQSENKVADTLSRADLEKDKALLVQREEFIRELADLKDKLAQMREEKGALEIKLAKLNLNGKKEEV